MTDLLSQSQRRTSRTWLYLAIAGCVLVALALAVTCLVIVDKERFGSLVGPAFLPVITGGLFVGAAMLIVGAWNLPVRRTWRGFVLFFWAAVALTSPLFGLLFLLPWGLLVITLPLVGWILLTIPRAGVSNG